MALEAGMRLGPYEILGSLGAGGMGEVYRAHDTRLARDVAIKVLPAALAADPSHIERFRREARAVASLTHPNIVTLHSVEEAGGIHFLTMELVEGRSLDREIRSTGFPLEQFLDIALALSDALAAAHDRGVVHRDLKPANVMIDGGGRVKVLDFGLAKVVGAEAVEIGETRLELTKHGTVVGTMPYMSPEQIEGRVVDARTDIFSLGVVLYELATGTRPFVGDSSPTVMAAILRDVPRPIADSRPELPGQLGRVIARCLEKQPQDRMQTAREVHDELSALRRESATQAALPPSGNPRSADHARRPGAGTTAGMWTAVLPFMHRGADPDLLALAEGLTEDITGGLSRFAYLKVVARQSAAQFVGQTRDVRSVGRELGTRYVLEGGVRKAGATIRVTVDLSDTETGAHLWAEKYDRDLGTMSLFAVQDDLTERVVATVADSNGVLVRSMAAGLRERPIEELGISDLILRSFAYVYQVRVDEHARLRDAFERALGVEPSNADGWASLARLYGHEHMWHANPLPDSIGRQRRAAQRAIDFDPACQLGWEVLAAACYFARDIDGFRPAAARAIALNPLDANVVSFMGLLLAYAGDWDQGIALVRRAMALNPQYPGWYHLALFHAHFRAGEYDDALQQVKRVNMPEFRWTHLATAAVCGHLGRDAEARAALDALRKLNPAVGLADARRDWDHWMHDAELVERLTDGLRKAGLEA